MKIILTQKEILDIIRDHIDDIYNDLTIRPDTELLMVRVKGDIEYQVEVD